MISLRIPHLLLSSAVLLATAFMVPVLAAGPLVPAAVPLDADGTMHISPADRCPVCAMRPARYPKSACAIQLSDGRTFYFCESGCLLRSWLHPDVHLGTAKSALTRVVVREYFSGAVIDGQAATWVAGSDVIGPMGPMIVPLDGDDHLVTFKRRHGARFVFRLSDLTDALWQQIFDRHP
ncbi:MAG: nitrous oxide reductase accessory protein NosL [Pseudomonadota bacterium]